MILSICRAKEDRILTNGDILRKCRMTITVNSIALIENKKEDLPGGSVG